MKVGVLNLHQSASNFGLGLTSDGLVHVLESRGHTVREIVIPGIFKPPFRSAAPYLNMSVVMSEKIPAAVWKLQVPRTADEFESLSKYFASSACSNAEKEVIAQLKYVDVVILNSEGAIYGNKLRSRLYLFLLWFSKTYLGKQTMFLNGMLGDLRHSHMHGIAAKTFETTDFIGVRDPISLRNLASLFPCQDPPEAHLVPDFAIPEILKIANGAAVQHPTTSEDKDRAVLSLGLLPSNRIRSKTRLKQTESPLLRILQEEFSRKEVTILVGDREDEPLIHLAKNEGWSIVRGDGSQQSKARFVESIKNSQMMLSGRYHHLLSGAVLGIPIMALDTGSHKNLGLIELLGKGQYPIQPGNISDPIESEKIRDFVRNPERIESRNLTMTTLEINRILDQSPI